MLDINHSWLTRWQARIHTRVLSYPKKNEASLSLSASHTYTYTHNYKSVHRGPACKTARHGSLPQWTFTETSSIATRTLPSISPLYAQSPQPRLDKLYIYIHAERQHLGHQGVRADSPRLHSRRPARRSFARCLGARSPTGARKIATSASISTCSLPPRGWRREGSERRRESNDGDLQREGALESAQPTRVKSA